MWNMQCKGGFDKWYNKTSADKQYTFLVLYFSSPTKCTIRTCILLRYFNRINFGTRHQRSNPWQVPQKSRCHRFVSSSLHLHPLRRLRLRARPRPGSWVRWGCTYKNTKYCKSFSKSGGAQNILNCSILSRSKASPRKHDWFTDDSDYQELTHLMDTLRVMGVISPEELRATW